MTLNKWLLMADRLVLRISESGDVPGFSLITISRIYINWSVKMRYLYQRYENIGYSSRRSHWIATPAS